MPAYDLSSADLGLVAGQEVDALMIANQLVWEASPEAPLFTLWAEAALTLTTHVDYVSANHFIANQFKKHVGDPLEVVDVGIYIPAGSSMIGLSGAVAVQSRSAAYNFDTNYDNFMSLTRTNCGPLVAGWNWCPLSTPYTWADANAHLLAGYDLGQNYVHNGTITDAAINEPVENLFELVQILGSQARSFYLREDNPIYLFGTTARSYGIDIRVRHAE